MPAIRMLGRRWQVSTDVLPLFALFSAFFYVLWLIYIVVAYFITVDVHGCNDTGLGRYYLATVALFFTEYVVSMVVAVCIAAIGLRGYGTYVVASMQPRYGCWASDYRRNLTRILVYLSWAMIMILDWGRMLILYNIAPDLQRMSSWVWRIRLLSWATGNKDVIQRLQTNESHPLESLTQLYKDLMHGADLTPADEVVALLLLAAHQRNMRRRHITRKLAGQNCCKGPPDFLRDVHLPDSKPSPDAQQHQYQQQRQQQLLHKYHQNGSAQSGTQHSKHGQGEDPSTCNGHKQSSSQSSQSTSSQATDYMTTSGSVTSTSPHLTEQMSPEQAHQVSSACHAAQQPPACQQLLANGGSAQGGQQQEGSKHITDNSASIQAQQQQQHQQAQHEQGAKWQASKPGKQKQHRPKLAQMHAPTGVDVEQGWGAGNDTAGYNEEYDAQEDSDVQVFEQGRGCGFPCVITPSSMAAELAPNLTQQQAAHLYLGQREAVEQEVLDTAAKFAKYAVAAYGQFGLKFKDEKGHQLGSKKVAMGKRFHSYKRNKLVRSKVKTHAQRMHYEAIIQVAQIQDEDLLYLNFSNAAVGDVPYIICLDRPSRSLVLSIRGTQSLADAATDLLAYPHPLHDWLPPSSSKGDEEEGTYGHAGMLGAAAAVWEDLCKNHLLAALLDLPADEDCKPAMQHHDHDDGEYDPRMSRSERDRHMEWEGGAAQNYDEGSAHGQARQAADAAKDHQHSSRNKHRPFGRHRGELADPPKISKAASPLTRHEQEGQNAEGQQGQECGLSLDQLGREDVGSQQELRNEDAQNRFVAGIIRRGLYKDGWKLVITGHSLGAGVAALLSLKMHARASGLKCWAFCPPGGLLSQRLSHAAEQYCTSIIVNKDMVSRMSLKTVYRLFEGKMIALARCNKTTSRVLLHAVMANSRRILLSDPCLFRPWSQVSNEAKDMLHRFQERPADDSISALGLKIGLYPPGKQIFLRRFKNLSQPKHAEDVSWDAVWIQPEEIIGEGILISKHAARDHYPFSLLSALGQVTHGIIGHVKRKTY